MSKNIRGSGIVLSGVEADQMVMDNGRSLATWGPWERTDLAAKIGASGAMPGWVPEPVKEFLTQPAPSSTGAMVGVTVAGAGISHLLGKFGGVEPGVRALLGAGLVLGGHYGLERWEAKSVGYGALFEGLAGVVQNHIQARRAAQGAAPGSAPGAVPPGPGLFNTIEESEFLEIVERDTRALPTPTTATGTVAESPDQLRARRMAELLERAEGLFGPQREPLDRRQPVRLASGEVITVEEYLRRFPDVVAQRRLRGSMARSRRAQPGQPFQTEADYLQWVMDYCRESTRPLVAPQENVRQAMDIQLRDGTFRPRADYQREFGWRLRLVALMCDRDERANAPDRRAEIAAENAAPNSTSPGSSSAGSSSAGGSSAGGAGGESMRDRLLGGSSAPPPGGEMFVLLPGQTTPPGLPTLAATMATASATPSIQRPKIDPNLVVNKTMTGSAGIKNRRTR